MTRYEFDELLDGRNVEFGDEIIFHVNIAGDGKELEIGSLEFSVDRTTYINFEDIQP